jgi:hypothetical protein
MKEAISWYPKEVMVSISFRTFRREVSSAISIQISMEEQSKSNPDEG